MCKQNKKASRYIIAYRIAYGGVLGAELTHHLIYDKLLHGSDNYTALFPKWVLALSIVFLVVEFMMNTIKDAKNGKAKFGAGSHRVVLYKSADPKKFTFVVIFNIAMYLTLISAMLWVALNYN